MLFLYKSTTLASLQVLTVVSCVGWMGVSSALIMVSAFLQLGRECTRRGGCPECYLAQVNKYLMSTDGFHYPMALSCLGMFFSSVASYLACRVRCDPTIYLFI